MSATRAAFRICPRTGLKVHLSAENLIKANAVVAVVFLAIGGATACLDFVLSGGAMLVPASANSLRRARELMIRYADCPMDFADATLVVLAEDLGTNLILTTDQRDFAVYRIASRKRFKTCV